MLRMNSGFSCEPFSEAVLEVLRKEDSVVEETVLQQILSLWVLDNAMNSDKWWRNPKYRCVAHSRALSDVMYFLNQLLGNDYFIRRDTRFFSNGIDDNPFGAEFSIMSHGNCLGEVTADSKLFYVSLSKAVFEDALEHKFNLKHCKMCSAPFPSEPTHLCRQCFTELVSN